MNQKNVLRNLVFTLLIVFTASFSYVSSTKKFNPAGTWEYTAPNVAEGYTTGEMVIVKQEKGYGVTMVISENYKAEANEVKYQDKSLKFSLYVEDELITIYGTFKKDKFTGKVSYSEGDFDITAVRKKEK